MQLHIQNDKLIEQDLAFNNQYLLLIGIVYFAGLLKDAAFQYYQLVTFDAIIILGCVIYAFMPDKAKVCDKMKLFIYGVILIFMLYFSLLFRFESITLFYIPLTFSLGIFFDFNKNRLQVLLLALLIVISIVLCYTIDSPLSLRTYSAEYKKYSDIVNIVNSILLSLFSIYSIIKSNQLLFSYQPEFNEMLMAEDGCSNELIVSEELNRLVYDDYTVFYLRFKESYPLFVHKIELMAPNLVAEEMKVIILMYLNYPTKEIAKITNSSFNAIQAKKHRIRRKLNVPTSNNIIDFLRHL